MIADPDVWIAFLTLVVLELVLGVENLVFIALASSRLPPALQARARLIGLVLAAVGRIAMLGGIAWLAHLSQPVVSVLGFDLSWRDLILVGGGAFLMVKALHEIHRRIEGPAEAAPRSAKAGLLGVIVQIVALDLVFSIDSVLTAIGLAKSFFVMAAAIVVAVAMMIAASGPLVAFIERHPAVKMLALAILLLIGTSLLADGLGFHLPKGFLYAAIGFAAVVEALNLLAQQRARRRS
jgi:predicted tellurium resistance membrane protein TerC